MESADLLPSTDMLDEIDDSDSMHSEGWVGEIIDMPSGVQLLLDDLPVDIVRRQAAENHDEGGHGDVAPTPPETTEDDDRPTTKEHGDAEEGKANDDQGGGVQSRKRTLSRDDDGGDGSECPICYSRWTTSGDHRICALKCGHLVGYRCLRQWWARRRTCPLCQSRIVVSDVRFVYANKLVAVDTTEIENAQMDLNAVMEEKNKITMALAQSFTKQHALYQRIRTLKRKLYDVSKQSPVPVIETHADRLYMDKSLEICKQAGCRVLGINSSLDMMLVSMRSPNNLFSGYGLKKMEITFYKPLMYIPLHSQPIRDVRFHQESIWALTVGMDKTARIVDLTTNSPVNTVTCESPLWSCCWDPDDTLSFYCGAQCGTVFKYDMRNLQAPVAALSVPGDMSPVVSVAKIPQSCGRSVGAGVVSCKLNSMWFFENNAEHTRHNLPLEGPFVSMKYHYQTEQLLVSARPNNQFQYARHTVCTLRRTESEVDCDVVHCFRGGGMQKLLSRSAFIKNGTSNYVAAYHESEKRVPLWSLNTGRQVASVPAHEAVLDIGGISNQMGDYLVFLTEKRAEFFKFH